MNGNAAEALAAQATRALGHVDILINSAGGSRPILFDASSEVWEEGMSKRYPTLEAEQEFAEAEIPAGRFGTAEEIGAVAVFLCSPIAAYV